MFQRQSKRGVPLDFADIFTLLSDDPTETRSRFCVNAFLGISAKSRHIHLNRECFRISYAASWTTAECRQTYFLIMISGSECLRRSKPVCGFDWLRAPIILLAFISIWFLASVIVWLVDWWQAAAVSDVPVLKWCQFDMKSKSRTFICLSLRNRKREEKRRFEWNARNRGTHTYTHTLIL